MNSKWKQHKGKIKIKCHICQKIFYRWYCHIFRNGKKKKVFCSNKCFSKWMKIRYLGKNNPHWSQKKIKCFFCKLKFLKKAKTIRKTNFCSITCRKKYFHSRNKIVVCYFCDKEFSRQKLQLTISKRHFCSQFCYGRYRAKKFIKNKNFNWKGGIARLPYPYEFNKELKMKIKERDKLRCQICDVPESELIFALHVHHIDYDKKNINPKNLVSLCKICHLKTNFDREFWKIILNEKVKEIYLGYNFLNIEENNAKIFKH